MGKTMGNEKLTVVFFGKFHSYMLPVGRRTLAEIYGYIKHPSFDASDEFRLAVRRALEVESAYYSERGA